MPTTVLARKWRPQSLDQIIGQNHVTQALSYALDVQRIHHAYLFTGTRGVGKTSLSRILAKSFNCEEKIAAKACGVCGQCQAMQESKNIDYMEVDAASNRGVEEISSILESALYQPSYGRFKIFMIDEVHMLSQHAFNAMLKILEEPPAYTKFILATTETHKIPATIVSRCLQFHLKNLHPHEIQAQLKYILEQEAIAFEAPALELLAKYAIGSMRDALSLTDQAIALGQGSVNLVAVQQMLGSQHLLSLEILQAILAKDLSFAIECSARYPQAISLMNDLLEHLHHIAMQQAMSHYLNDIKHILTDSYQVIAKSISPLQTQMMYEILIKAKESLELSPAPQMAVNMLLIRLSHFTLWQFEANPHDSHPANNTFALNIPEIKKPKVIQEASQNLQIPQTSQILSSQIEDKINQDALTQSQNLILTEVETVATSIHNQSPPSLIQQWPNIVKQLQLIGLTLEFAKHTALHQHNLEKNELTIIAGMNVYSMKVVADRFQAAVDAYFKKPMKIYFIAPGKVEAINQAELSHISQTNQINSNQPNPPTRLIDANLDAQNIIESKPYALAAPTLSAQEAQEKQQQQAALNQITLDDPWVKQALVNGAELVEIRPLI